MDFFCVRPRGEKLEVPIRWAAEIVSTALGFGVIIGSRCGSLEYARSRVQVAQSLQGYIRYEYSDITGRKVETRSYAALSDALSGNDEDTTRIKYTYDELGRLFETVVVKRDGTELATPEVTTSYFGCVKPFQILPQFSKSIIL